MATIRQATLDDTETLAHLAERIFRETFATEDNLADLDLYCAENFGLEVQQREILDSNCITLLVEVETDLVAFADVRLHSPNACVSSAKQPSELRRLYVEKKWHGRGIAHQVMVQVLSTVASVGADYIWLGVWEHNPRAIAFYRKYGFEVVGEHVFQFGSDPQRDLVMVARVNNSVAPSDSQII